jgi:hypothetical protein
MTFPIYGKIKFMFQTTNQINIPIMEVAQKIIHFHPAGLVQYQASTIERYLFKTLFLWVSACFPTIGMPVSISFWAA